MPVNDPPSLSESKRVPFAPPPVQQRSKDAGLQGEGGPGAGSFGGGISPQTAAALQALVLHQASFMQALQVGDGRWCGGRCETTRLASTVWLLALWVVC